MDDLYSSYKTQTAIAAVAVGTTGTGKTGKIIDRKGYIGPVLFDISYGTITATNATLTVTVKEGDVTGTLTSVADIDLIGTEALAGIGATGTRTSGTSKNVAKKIAYKGAKRYVQCNIKSTVTAGPPISANAVQRPHSMPAA
ncbi:hypothetical protein [Mesorhizobium neociceri]|uniref:Uncharacterized protein n=1 Tax=Mesorhizobium neociceri TaxID=1307853 RepID=A0A838B5S4_9HYPH|nr:hypothetical protein [Mesorhizobium neociceri]MBA1141745.1 hypothetical protein [Mesorhizobium neociceri]